MNPHDKTPLNSKKKKKKSEEGDLSVGVVLHQDNLVFYSQSVTSQVSVYVGS